MKISKAALGAALIFSCGAAANADIIAAGEYPDETVFGAETLTGALPNIGGDGNSVTLGDATLTAGNTIFVGDTYTPGRNSIAISGQEDLDIAINVGLSRAFGFYFFEPQTNTDLENGCNATCFESEFSISFFLGNVFVDSTTFAPKNDAWFFYGIRLDENFDEVRFDEIGGTIDNEFFGEMYVTRVPEPGTLALLGMGLVGIGFARRRKKAA